MDLIFLKFRWFPVPNEKIQPSKLSFLLFFIQYIVSVSTG